jgi:WD40 repeat protein
MNLGIDRFRYDAFISYSRRDMAFAVQLQKALERYRLPRLAGKVRRRLRIFRDQSDLIGADYFDSIDAALTESAKLILVCSPEAARSMYVNDEVRRFVERRGADNIIPLLLSGLPNNEVSPEQEDGKAFPPALCEALEMPLAIDYRGIEPDDSKLHRGRFRHAWLSMLAGTLDVSREEIEERDRVRRRRQLAVIGTIAAGIIVALSVLTIYALVQRGIAEWQRGRAEDRARVAIATNLLDRDPARAALVLVEVEDPEGTTLATATMHAALRWSLPEVEFPVPNRQVVDSISPNRDRYVTTISNDFDTNQGGAWLWDARDGSPIAYLEAPGSVRVAAAVFSPRGDRLLTAYGCPSKPTKSGFVPSECQDEVQAHVWDTHNGTRIATLKGPVTQESWVSDGIAAFSPSGDRVVLASRDQKARVWKLEGPMPDDGRPHFELKGHTGSVWSASFSPDESLVATISYHPGGFGDGTTRVWNGHDGSPVATLPTGKGIWGNPVSFSPDSRLVLTEDGQVWDVVQQSRIFEFRKGEQEARFAFISPTGDRVVTILGDGSVRVWDVDWSNFERSRNEQSSYELVSASTPILDPVHRFAYGRVVSFSGDGKRVVTVLRDGTARVWWADKGGPVGKIKGPAPFSFAWLDSQGDRVWTFPREGDEKVVQVWHTEPSGSTVLWGRDESLLGFQYLTVYGIRQAVFSPDGEHVATVFDDGKNPKVARVWKRDGSKFIELNGPEEARLSAPVAFSPNGKWVAAGYNGGTVRIWNVGRVPHITEFRHDDPTGVSSVSFAPHGGWALSTSGREARLWQTDDRVDAQAGSATVKYMSLLHKGLVSLAAFNPDNGRVVTASSGTVQLWRVDDGSPIGVPMDHKAPVNLLVFSPSGNRLLTVSGQLVWLWQTDDRAGTPAGSPIDKPRMEHKDPVISAIFSPTGNQVLTISSSGQPRGGHTSWEAQAEGTAILWRVDGSTFNNGKDFIELGAVATYTPFGVNYAYFGTDPTARAAFSPSGDRIVAVSRDGTLGVWQAESGSRVGTIKGARTFYSVAYASNGKYVLTSDNTGLTSWVWKVEDGSLIAELEGHWQTVQFAAFNPNGDRVLTGSKDGTTRVWPLSGAEVSAAARTATRVCLDPGFRTRSLGESLEEAWRTYDQCVRCQVGCVPPNVLAEWLAESPDKAEQHYKDCLMDRNRQSRLHAPRKPLEGSWNDWQACMGRGRKCSILCSLWAMGISK